MGRWRRLTLVVLTAVLAATAGTMLMVAGNVVTGGSAASFPLVGRHPLWWTVGATAAVAVAALLVWASQQWYERGLVALIPAVQRPERWVVDRPSEVGQIVAALRRRGGTVGITTAVQGAGGFGKTTVAKIVRADRRVLRRYGRRVYWVTVGRDAGMQALTGLVNGLIAQIDQGRTVTFTDARQAGEHLAALFATGPRRLLVLDDVWSPEQLAAFPISGRCARLVTTRIPSLTGGNSIPVKVDQMSREQARALLLAGLPPLPTAVTGALVQETGRWPLLLRLINKVLADQARLQPDIAEAAGNLLSLLRAGRAWQVDLLTGSAAQHLDISDPDQRQKAVTATIQASTSLLSPAEQSRFAELAIFAEDETIPVTLITNLWGTTGKLDRMAARALCVRLADLALLTLIPDHDGGTVSVHDVIRDLLREQLGPTRLIELQQVLREGAANGLPRTPAAAGSGTVTAWWELPASARYLWEHLIEHLIAAGRCEEAEELAADLRWAGARLQMYGPAAPYTDLTLIGSPRARRLAQVLGQAAHLLAPTDPSHSLVDILYSRVSHDPDWGPQAQILTRSCKLPALTNKWPLPDLPHPALRRIVTGHTASVNAVAIAPDGTWLASVSDDGTVRIWDAATGQQRATLAGHIRPVSRVAIAPDGTWLATVGWDQSVRIWDATTYQERAKLPSRTFGTSPVAIAPDGNWLATVGWDWSVRIWDATTYQQRAKLSGRPAVIAMAIAPDGTWLATASRDNTVRIWDATTYQQRAKVTGHFDTVGVVVIAPDGTWLATDSRDGTARIWDVTTGEQRARLSGHTGEMSAVVIASDGTWLATTSRDLSVRIWDAATGQQRARLTGHTGTVTAVVIASDGTWLATTSRDLSVRIWDASTGRHSVPLTGHTRAVTAVAIAPDGTWLATTNDDGTVRIRDAATGQQRARLTSHSGTVTAVAIAPDGTWLAISGDDGTVQIRDAATGWRHATLIGHTGTVRAIAIAPDGAWLTAVGGSDTIVRTWDAATGLQRVDLTGHTRPVNAVAIAPDGTWLATASDDGTVRTWDATTGQQRTILTGPFGAVSAVAIAPDGTWLAAASGNTLRSWDAATGQQRTIFTGPFGAVSAVAIAPDGTWLAATSDDGTVRILDVATGRISALMRVDGPLADCAWTSSGLTARGVAGLYYFTFKP